MSNEQESLQQLRQELKSLKDKCDLQSKKIKLFRKQNEEYKHQLTRQAQIDSSLLLNSKELSEANCKLEGAVHDISLKLQIELQANSVTSHIRTSRPLALITIKNITITQETEEVDLPNEEISDQDICQLSPFKTIKSLLLGENCIGNKGVVSIMENLHNLVKLQLNSNKFEAEALQGIGKLNNLKILDIRNNNLGDGCMKHLSNLRNLTQLSISKNKISDKGLSMIENLTHINYLDLTTNSITDQGMSSLMNFKKLTHLYLMANQITQATVPQVFKNLKELQVLDIRFIINDSGVKQSLRGMKPEKLQLFC